MKYTLRYCFALLLMGGLLSAQDHAQVTEEVPGGGTDLDAFRARVAASHPDLDVVSVAEHVVAPQTPQVQAKPARIALFVRNQSVRRELDDEVDPLRNVIAAELAGSGLVVLDASDMVAGFHRYKVTTDEERQGLIDGLFAGGSVVRVAQMIGADYVALVSLVHADARARMVNDQRIVTYQTMLSVRVLEASSGASIYGRNVQERYPVSTGETSGSDVGYFRDLVYDAAGKIGQALAVSHTDWRLPEPLVDGMVTFHVRTTVDELVDGLEQGVRGPNALLDEMRRVVGGVTVELNGAAIGSAPGTFHAAPGMHQLRVTRQWMEPWQHTVQIQEGSEFVIGLTLSETGLARFQNLEGFKAMIALAYAEAAYRKGIQINFDTQGWRDIAVGAQGYPVQIVE